MRRREFILALPGATALPFALHAQHASKMPTIGILGSATEKVWAPWIAAFVQRLRALGLIEGRTVAIEYRYAEGRHDRMLEIAAEFARIKVDVILTAGTSVPSIKQVASAVPTVFALSVDPVGTGLVASLARPGGNVTGLTTQSADIGTKRFGLLREIVPRLNHLAIIANVAYPDAAQEMNEVVLAAGKLGIGISRLEIRTAADIHPALDALQGRADALYVCTDSLVTSNRLRINTLALAARLPTMHAERGYIESGGLMSYGPNYPDLFRRAGDYVEKILHGTKPADIPVEQPTKFDLVINLTTAKSLGLRIPETFLLRADEVIE
jgi:putative ABC transport system substrate-binding protein